MSPPAVGLPGKPHLVFQPAVDLATGSLIGFEALLRWANGAGSSIPLDILIPWAEDRGHMTALNAWVLSEACGQAARWPPDLKLAVNCSVFQLRRGEAAIAAASALERTDLSPNRLTIEVTEDSVTDNQATADLRALHRLGIQVALDDVGPNWSILNNLPECVVNAIKIDAVLVADLAASEGVTRSVVETIVKVSRSLGISTVAEAVETADQVAILREIGVEVAQGYFFSRPLSAKNAYALAVKKPLPTFPLAGDVPAVPSPATLRVPPEPPAPGRAVPSQATLRVPPEPPSFGGPVPDQAPVPVTRKPLPPMPEQVNGSKSETETGTGTRPGTGTGTGTENILAAQDVKIDNLSQGIAQLVTAVERLNELLEPWLLGPRGLVGHTPNDKDDQSG